MASRAHFSSSHTRCQQAFCFGFIFDFNKHYDSDFFSSFNILFAFSINTKIRMHTQRQAIQYIYINIYMRMWDKMFQLHELKLHMMCTQSNAKRNSTCWRFERKRLGEAANRFMFRMWLCGLVCCVFIFEHIWSFDAPSGYVSVMRCLEYLNISVKSDTLLHLYTDLYDLTSANFIVRCVSVHRSLNSWQSLMMGGNTVPSASFHMHMVTMRERHTNGQTQTLCTASYETAGINTHVDKNKLSLFFFHRPKERRSKRRVSGALYVWHA